MSTNENLLTTFIEVLEENKHLWIVIATVLFFIGAEFLYARTKGMRLFRFENTVSNLLMGVFDRVAGLFMIPLIWYYYNLLYDSWHLFEIPNTKLWFAFAVLLSDFIWYFYHKSGHRINLFWGAHIIHHQSEDYNYTVALNLTPFQVMIRVLFWSFMPLLGFKPEVVLGTHVFIGLYQFLLHTTVIPKLGFIEKILVTPSHHRVHHGSNPEYIDKNYGGVLIIWDRMFGTFQEEKAEVSYGITQDINSRDLVTLVFHYYQNLIFIMRQIPSWREKIILLFKGPDWKPSSAKVTPLSLYIKKDTYLYKNYSLVKKSYIITNIALVMSTLGLVAFFAVHLLWADFITAILFILLSLVINGRLLENKKVLWLEVIRWGSFCVWGTAFFIKHFY